MIRLALRLCCWLSSQNFLLCNLRHDISLKSFKRFMLFTFSVIKCQNELIICHLALFPFFLFSFFPFHFFKNNLYACWMYRVRTKKEMFLLVYSNVNFRIKHCTKLHSKVNKARYFTRTKKKKSLMCKNRV
jgi:hypothetical protein